MAGDRRATAGYTIASRRIEKVFPADDFSGVAIAGAAGPAVEMVKLFQIQLEHYEKVQGDVLSLEGKANQLGQLVRANLPAAMQGFAVVPLFAGYDDRRDRGRVFSYDVTGGRYEELDFQAQGSGSVHARNWIKAGLARGHGARRRRSTLAIRSLFAAADEDVATGGPDLVRGIFPTVAVIDADGYRALTDDEVDGPQPALLCRVRERGGARVMSMPFYVSPEQVMKDRADYARKGIARGRSLRRPRVRGRRRSSSPTTRRARCRRSARSTTASRSPRSASTTSSRCCASPACATPTSRATRTHAKT